MHVKEAEKQLLLFLREEQLKHGGMNPDAQPYLYRWPTRPRVGIRVSELGWSTSHAGMAYMQSDIPYGLLVCAAAERLLLDLTYEDLDEAENSKWALAQAIWPDKAD